MSTDGYRIGRKLHLLIGLIGALWLVFMSVTGILINHQESLGLADREVSDRFLPDGYRADVRNGSTRLNVVITDLHSGRFFGKYGYLIGDIIGALLIFSVLSGVYMYWFSRKSRPNRLRILTTPTSGDMAPTPGSDMVPHLRKEVRVERI